MTDEGDQNSSLTVCAIRIDQASHSHVRRTLQETLGDNTICFGNSSKATLNGKDAIVYAWHNFAHSRSDASLFSKISNILAGLADDDASFLGGHNGTECEFLVRIVIVAARLNFALINMRCIIRAEAVELLTEVGRVLRNYGDCWAIVRHNCNPVRVCRWSGRGENWCGTQEEGELRLFKNLSHWRGEVSHGSMDFEVKAELTEWRDVVGCRHDSLWE